MTKDYEDMNVGERFRGSLEEKEQASQEGVPLMSFNEMMDRLKEEDENE